MKICTVCLVKQNWSKARWSKTLRTSQGQPCIVAVISCSPGENSAPGYSGMDASPSPISYKNSSIFYFCFFQDLMNALKASFFHWKKKKIIFQTDLLGNKPFAGKKEKNKTIQVNNCPNKTFRQLQDPYWYIQEREAVKIGTTAETQIYKSRPHLCHYWAGCYTFWTMFPPKMPLLGTFSLQQIFLSHLDIN